MFGFSSLSVSPHATMPLATVLEVSPHIEPAGGLRGTVLTTKTIPVEIIAVKTTPQGLKWVLSSRGYRWELSPQDFSWALSPQELNWVLDPQEQKWTLDPQELKWKIE